MSINIWGRIITKSKSEEDLPACAPSAVCSKVDVYDTPWIQRQCRCPGGTSCSDSLRSNDGFTITDKTRQFKMCEPTKKLRKCRYFRDITWSYITFPQNVTQQIVHCACPKNSVAYIVKRKMFYSAGELGYHYAFACSPQSRLRCQRKEPCRLFTVRKKERHQEVNTSTLCQCPHNHRCPKHHLDPGVIPGKAYIEDNIRTFSGYCISIFIISKTKLRYKL
ncbi:Protein giant-lens [Armadillidium vulgare]|nr:Protein giant-lens [Armadillidium vulgare]